MSMSAPLFTMRDESFTCCVCGTVVLPYLRSARDHCNVCLCSLHVDVNPGDRAADCGGVLRPVRVLPHKKGMQLVFVCEKCGTERRNIVADDDNYDAVLEVARGAGI